MMSQERREKKRRENIREKNRRENILGAVEIRDTSIRKTENQTDTALKVFLSVYCVLMMLLQAEE